jgi:response regulator RpfG family c-di-GMP phosphodiesterase
MHTISPTEGSSRRALVLVVDPKAETRHWMWRLLHRTFGVLEAPNAQLAKNWIRDRPDIDAIIVEDELPDARGSDLVKELARAAHPVAQHAIVVASEWRRVMLAGLVVVERGDIKTILQKLAIWFVAANATRVSVS